MTRSSVVQPGKKPPVRSGVIDQPIQRAVEMVIDRSGQWGQVVLIKCGKVIIDSREIDCEFEVPFDDNTEANEALIIVYNLTDRTINQLKMDAVITIEAGYGEDIGMIFSGVITYRKTRIEQADKVTKIYAVDDVSREERKLENVSYSKNTKASYILKDLCEKVGLPIAVFKVERDHTYKESVTINSDIMASIEKYAKICGVSAYICKQKIYVRSLKDGDNLAFALDENTGLLSANPFEEEETNEDYEDKIEGYELEMLLQHRIQTASVIHLKSVNYSGTYRVREGTHDYDGTNFLTRVKVV